jgi:hypothetical protein
MLARMLKVLAVLRTVFLIFIVAFTVRSMPWSMDVSRTFDEQYARCSDALSLVIRAAWVAIGWIAFETAVGWWLATRPPKLHEKDLPKPGGEPPFAPPPHG